MPTPSSIPARSVTALGASFSAGPGLRPYSERRAGRSRDDSLGALVAARLGCPLVDAAVSGATTGDILDHGQRLAGHRFERQIELLRPDADVVTICVGGNDLGHVGTAMAFATAGRLERWRLAPLARRVRARVPELPAHPVDVVARSLTRVVDAVRERAPQSRIVLVDYLPLVTVADAAAAPVHPVEAERIVSTAATLTAGFECVAEDRDVRLVRSAALGEGHALGSPDPWIQSLRLIGAPDRMAGSLHPTRAGMRAVADAVVASLGDPYSEMTSHISGSELPSRYVTSEGGASPSWARLRAPEPRGKT